ncbi:MAG TPA: phosphoglycerate dehydrogenase [Candidatus Dormibacteraeota bacterium]|nr:phosphoglycerate dehydrogenase [Candidatus Dormibacteraeota bacterium]
MKILVADSVPDNIIEILKADPSWEVVNLPKTKGKVAEEIHDADALLVRSATKVTAELLDKAKNLKAIGRAGVGVDNVDLDAATRKGVLVMNTPGGNAISVAEHTLALLLAMAHPVTRADASMKAGKWEKKKLLGSELRDKTLGLIGLGTIGTEVARLAQAHKMTVVAFDPYVSPLLATEQNISLLPLEDVLKTSDYISLHCSLTPETNHLINAKNLALTKKGVRIVNCARGELVDESALLAAIESGQVAGAGLDVFETEPPADPRLINLPAVIATPHIAGSTEEAQNVVGTRIAEQLRNYLVTGAVKNAVNMPSISPEEFKKLDPYVQLGEKLGTFVAQLADKPISEVSISYDGGLADLNTHLVKNAVLKGVLSQILAEQINLINAGSYAKARGIEVVEVRSGRRAAYSNSLGVALRTGGESVSVLGMIGLNNVLRVLGVNNIDIEAPLKGFLLVIRNQDIPGVIGRVGTLLGQHKINIANFALGRVQNSDEAIGIVNVDQKVSPEVLAELRAIQAVRQARVIEIG